MTETKSIKFKNRRYDFEQTIQTQLSVEYVPDWGLFEAIRESLQNALDEGTQTGATVNWYEDGPGTMYLYDRGRGVDLEDILFLGVSGKRGLEDVVGQHGEGEVISSLVAARLGVTKVMASKDWLTISHLVDVNNHSVLALDVYRTLSPRKGTAWSYAGPNVIETFDRSLRVFRQVKRCQVAEARQNIRAMEHHVEARRRRREKNRILRNEPGQLFTRGMEVNRITHLALGYDLDATPGRDRGGFTWEQIKDEIASLLAKYAGAEDIRAILDAAHYHGCDMILELSLEVDFDPAVVKRAAYLVTRSRSKYRIVWAGPNDSSYVTDVSRSGKSRILVFHSSPPEWISDNFPHVAEAASSHYLSEPRSLPQYLQATVDELKTVLPGNVLSHEVKIIHRFDDPDARAVRDGDTIVFSRKAVKTMSFPEFVGVYAHELSHYWTGAPDCTREHEQGVREILVTILHNVSISDEGRAAFQRARKNFDWYVS